MGGTGSGKFDDGIDRGGRRPRSAINVCGVGLPEMPDDLPPDVQREWHRLLALTSGVTFSQDADIIVEVANWTVEQRELRKLIRTHRHDVEAYDKLSRLSLAVGRHLLTGLGKLGLDPRSRQALLIPKKEEAKSKTRLEQIRDRRGNQ